MFYALISYDYLQRAGYPHKQKVICNSLQDLATVYKKCSNPKNTLVFLGTEQPY